MARATNTKEKERRKASATKRKEKEKRSLTEKARPPKWLPDGWVMEVDVTNKKKTRCYLSPASGYKFCSKKEVLDYLTVMKNDSHTSAGDNGQNVVLQVKSSHEWLPPGWILEIRVHKSGEQAGQKYESYYDPSSGSRFHSKDDVFSFLGSRQLHAPTPKQKICSTSHTMDDVLAEVEYSPDGLPPGWIKEFRVRKSFTNGKGIRKDPYYTDPVHGYVFRSLKDAIRYVATGQKRKRTSVTPSLEGASPPLNPATELNSLGVTVTRCLFADELETSNAEMATEEDDTSEKLQLPPAGNACIF